MIVKNIIYEDVINYKKTSMFIAFPRCSFKCDKLNGCQVCQNLQLANEPDIEIDVDELCKRYLNNGLTEAIVVGGLDPMDSFDDLFEFIWTLRLVYECEDDVVIYTGYYDYEIADKINILSRIPNIIVKFGRYIINQQPHFDEVLGVNLASDNQYAKHIS